MFRGLIRRPQPMRWLVRDRIQLGRGVMVARHQRQFQNPASVTLAIGSASRLAAGIGK